MLEAIDFAAGHHRDQRRKDDNQTPYINHPLEVAWVLANVGAVDDVEILQAAVLHDTVEDTAATVADVRARFGDRVAGLVAAVSDDKTLDKAERKRLQIVGAPALPREAKLIKLADKTCNVRDIVIAAPSGWDLARRRDYLRWAERVVEGCRGVSAALEQRFDEVLADGRSALNADSTEK